MSFVTDSSSPDLGNAEIAPAGKAGSRFFLIIWPLATCIPILAKPRITLFDVICIFIILSRPGRVYGKTLATRRFLYLAVLYNAVYLISSFITGASLFQTIWRIGSTELVIIDALAMWSALKGLSLAKVNGFLFYFCVGICLQIFYPEDTMAYTWPIKFLLNTPLGIVLVSVAYAMPVSERLQRLMSATALLFYSAICVFAGARNAAAVELAPVVMYFLPPLQAFRNFNVLAYSFSLAGAAAGLYAIVTTYYNLAVSGFFGYRAKGIAQVQGSFFGGGVGLLLGGRPEIIVLGLGIIAAPWFGHGVGNDLILYKKMLVAAQIWNPTYLDIETKTIIHSVLFGAGFEAGIFAMLFWLYICHLFLRAIVYIYGNRITGFEIPLLLVIQALWNVLFSPLIGTTRLSIAPAIFYAFALHQRASKNS